MVWGWMDEGFTKEIENAVRHAISYMNEYEPNNLDYPEFLAKWIGEYLRRKYWFRQRYSVINPGKYLLVEEGDLLPHCIDCEGSRGGCGTPCQNCEKAEKFNENWDLVTWQYGEYMIYKEKNSET